MNWISVRHPMTYDEVIDVGNQYGIQLPHDYMSQIGPINGGALRDAFIDVPELGKVAYSRNVSLSKKSKVNIFDLISPFNLENIQIFPFAEVGNGDYFCFNLSENCVVLYIHENGQLERICNTFTELMKLIVQNNA